MKTINNYLQLATLLLVCILIFNGLILKYIFDKPYYRHITLTIQSPVEPKSRVRKSRNRFENNNAFQEGLVADLWSDICLSQGTQVAMWHPLFPSIPQDRHTLFTLDSGVIADHLDTFKRVYGFLDADDTILYKLRIRFSKSIELVLVDMNSLELSIDMYTDYRNLNLAKLNKVFYYHHQEEAESDDRKIVVERFVKLPEGVYLIELLTTGSFEVTWYEMDFWMKGALPIVMNVFHLNHFTNATFPSYFAQIHSVTQRFPVSITENLKHNFYNIPSLPLPSSQKIQIKACPLHRLRPRTVKLYEGINLIDNLVIYPKEYFEFTDNMPIKKIMMAKVEAESLAESIFDFVNSLYKE